MEGRCVDISIDDTILLNYKHGSFLAEWVIRSYGFICYEYFIFISLTFWRYIQRYIEENVYNVVLHITSYSYMVLYHTVILFFNSSPSNHFSLGKVIQHILYSPFSKFIIVETYSRLSQYSFLLTSPPLSRHLLYVNLSHPLYSFMDFSLQ